MKFRLGQILLFALVLLAPTAAHAYVGPGAGVAFLTTALLLITTIVLALLGLLLYPFRQAWRLYKRKKPPHPPRIKRAVVLGLDGLDPDLVKRWMDEGKLPNMQKLGEMGTFSKLATTYPAMSPVAWSSFATGVQPSKHGIFDFLTRDLHTYLPKLSSSMVGGPKRHLRIGSLTIPIGKPEVKFFRKSKSFWKVLGEHSIPCSILRVPITFPPEGFEGTLLSAMCVPDMQGTQGSFSYFTTDDSARSGKSIGGHCHIIDIKENRFEAALPGPPNPMRADGKLMDIPFTMKIDSDDKCAHLKIGKEAHTLYVDKFSPWVPVSFKMGLGLKAKGMVRFRILEMGERFRLYVSPINVDPANPAMPISHPFIFSVFLAKLCGRFATLGLAEDTWALNEDVLTEDAFLEHAWDNHAEREAMFFEMLKRTPKGLITCVFDGTDRIQHMFMRYMDEGHPALKGDEDGVEKYGKVIEETYQRADELVGKMLEKVDAKDPETLVMVLSDHGFKSFRRGVNLNSWLQKEGYLFLKDDDKDTTNEWLRAVDWTKTKAYAMGLGGIFLNVAGREGHGIVKAGAEARALAEDIAQKLTGLCDPGVDDNVAIQEAYTSHKLYKGPYAGDAPEIIVGYAAGWRASWDSVRGIVNDVVFDDNTKAWSGDHCIDPKLVPGVLISNFALDQQEEPSIADIAPTMLNLFGIDAPRYMDGKSLTSA